MGPRGVLEGPQLYHPPATRLSLTCPHIPSSSQYAQAIDDGDIEAVLKYLKKHNYEASRDETYNERTSCTHPTVDAVKIMLNLCFSLIIILICHSWIAPSVLLGTHCARARPHCEWRIA